MGHETVRVQNSENESATTNPEVDLKSRLNSRIVSILKSRLNSIIVFNIEIEIEFKNRS